MQESTSLIRFLDILRENLPVLQERFHVENLELFGSYVRGEADEASDLDILVTYTSPPSLLRFVALENHLSDTLGVQVDLVMKDGLKTALEDTILKEAVSV